MTDNDHNLGQKIKQAAKLLHGAERAVALTGAGVSTPSGIPDFRSENSGLWQQANPMAVASLWGFRQDPSQFFDWIRPLARLMRDAEPNPAHDALATLEKRGYLDALITQNIDVLHSRAGSQTIYEVHGHMRESTCVECFRVYPTESFLDAFIASGEVPRCSHCNGVLKPNVILFGEALPFDVLRAAQEEARNCDVMLIAGSFLEVAPVSDLPRIALAHNAQLIIINYEATYVDQRAAVVMHENVAEVLPRLVTVLESEETP